MILIHLGFTVKAGREGPTWLLTCSTEMPIFKYYQPCLLKLLSRETSFKEENLALDYSLPLTSAV